MSPKRYSTTKEAISADRLSDATAGAMVAQVYELPKKHGGMDMDALTAARRAAMVSLGKRSMLFHFGNRHEEAAPAVEELVAILRNPRDPRELTGPPQVKQPVHKCAWIARAALYELTFDRCGSCFGRGEVEDHNLKIEGRQPMKSCETCFGSGRRRYNEDFRIKTFARAVNPEDEAGAEKSLRKMPSRELHALLDCVNVAKGVLLAAERVAVEGTGLMLERWKTEDF